MGNKPGIHGLCVPVNFFDLRCENVTFISYTMDKSGLPDIYAQSTRAAGMRTEDVYIRQSTSAHGITNM